MSVFHYLTDLGVDRIGTPMEALDLVEGMIKKDCVVECMVKWRNTVEIKAFGNSIDRALDRMLELVKYFTSDHKPRD